MDPLKPHDIFATSGAAVIKAPSTPTGISIPESHWAKAFQKDEQFQSWRGQIINNALSIEEQIEKIISKIFFKEDNENADKFHSFILSREFFTFMNKWKVLRDILNSVSPYKERDYKQLKTDLLNIVNTRDNFAHGKVDYSEGKIILKYFKNEPQEEEISEDTLKNFIELVKKCRLELSKIISELK